jgi:hypothetical protein
MKNGDRGRYPKGRLRNPVQLRLREVFGDLELVDAKEPLTVFPTHEDFEAATQADPHGCGFQLCAKRICKSKAALVFRTASYIDHPGKDGVRRIYRYINSSGVRRAVFAYDTRGAAAVDTSAPFVFYAPAPSLTLKVAQRRSRALRRGPRRVILDHWEAKRKLRQYETDLSNQSERLERLRAERSPQSPLVIETREQVDRLQVQARRWRERERELRSEADALRTKPYRQKAVVGGEHNLAVRNGTGYLNPIKAKPKR